MRKRIFSNRYSFRPAPDEVPLDSLPLAVRDGLGWVLERTFGLVRSPSIFSRSPTNQLGDLLAVHMDTIFRKRLDWNSLRDLIWGCQWYEFYDICEACHQFFTKIEEKSFSQPFPFNDFPIFVPTGLAPYFENELNRLFEDHGLKWRLIGASLERYRVGYGQHIVQETRALLTESRFEGPDQRFQKALACLSRRPQPDTGQCVNEAVGALEGIAGIVSGHQQMVLADILQKEPFKARIHPTIRESLENINAYRCYEAAIDHTTKSQPEIGPDIGPDIGIEEAELILTNCAGAILYLARKFGSPDEKPE